MTDNLGLNNRVYQILSQNSQKAAVDILGMRISTKYKNKFVILSTIDNLIKGGSGQAIQNMNLRFGFPLKTGLI